jgi:hypothetical protein
MVIVISRAGDSHTAVVLQRLSERGVPTELVDLSDFPHRASLSLRRRSHARSEHHVRWADWRKICFEDASAIWWRRPQSFQFQSEILEPGMAAFAQVEVQEAFAGLWLSLDAFWINHPARDQEAGRKVYQLRLAAELGLDIPDTLITCDPEDARRFIERYGPEQTIYKAFSATARLWRETRVLKHDELAFLGNVRFAPVIFQEYIPADVDLRITVVGDRIFPAAIYSQQTSYKEDFRMDMASAKVEACRLPVDVEEKLLALMQRLGLVYGAIDMRRTPQGRHVFLEINPAGQWLFVEDRTGQSITDALCSEMARH